MSEGLLLDPCGEEHWNDLLLATPAHSFFHTSNWAMVLQKSYGYRPLYLVCHGEKSFDALFPMMEVNSLFTGRRGVNLPFTDYCEPVVSDPAQFKTITKQVIDLAHQRSWRYLEIRGGSRYFPDDLSPSMTHYGHSLDLTIGSSAIFMNLPGSLRRNIRKALRENVKIDISCSSSAIRQFYILNIMTRRRHGLLPQPFSFFKNIYDHILSKGLGFVVLAYHNNVAIAANIYFHFGSEVIYKYGASNFDFQHLRANSLIMWEAIDWCCNQGYRRFCFGRTDSDHDGLRRFKLSWGTQEHSIKYYLYETKAHDFVTYNWSVHPFYRRVFSTLPAPILITLGNSLYRHMG